MGYFNVIAFVFSVFLSALAMPGQARADCSDPAAQEGTQIYNSTYKTMQFCDGATWWDMKSGGGGSALANVSSCADGDGIFFDSATGSIRCPNKTPDAFTFTDQTDVGTSILVESDIEQITGIETAVSISISGDGSPEFRICEDASCTTEIQTWGSAAQTVNNGEYLQLRLTSNASTTTTNSATVTVGSGSNQWDVTTGDIPTTWTVRGGEYTSAGAYTYTVPAGVSYIKVQAWGGPGARGAMCLYSCCAWNNYSGGDNPGSTFATSGGTTLLASLGGTSSVGLTAGTGRGYSIDGSVLNSEGFDGSNVAPCNPPGPGFTNCTTDYPSQYHDKDVDDTVLWNPSASGFSGDTCGCTAKTASGGNGGYASGIIPVSPGEQFTVTVSKSPGHTCTESGGAWHASAAPGRVVVWEP